MVQQTLSLLAGDDQAAAAVSVAAAELARGGVVLAPTETFYGLLARVDRPRAVRRIFALKGRQVDKVLPLVVASVARVHALCHVSDRMARLMAAFWPGPLTLLLPAKRPLGPGLAAPAQGASNTATAGGPLVGLRVSSHAWLQALAAAVPVPLTATSANVAGAPPARALGDVLLGPAVGQGSPPLLAIDGGQTAGGLPSTLVQEDAGQPHGLRLVRAGAVAEAALWAALA